MSDATELLDQLAEVVRGGQSSLESAADELESITQPEDAEEANGKLVEGLRALAGEFAAFPDALDAGELTEIGDLATRFQGIGSSPAIATLQEATDDLKAKGYDIEGEEG